jgi:hypothetical protein
MRRVEWAMAVVSGLVAATPAAAQQAGSIPLTGGTTPQGSAFPTVINAPQTVAPQFQPQTTDKLSLRRLVAKVVPFVSAESKTIVAPPVPAVAGSAQPSPLQPLLPPAALPSPQAGGLIQPLPPTTTMPAPAAASPLQPVLPISK